MEDLWKKAFIALVIVMIAAGCILGVTWRFNQVQLSFNRRLASEAASLNAQLRELRSRMDSLEEATLNLDGEFSEDQTEQDQRMTNFEDDLERLGFRIDGWNQQLNLARTKINEFEMRMRLLSGNYTECCSGNYTCDQFGCYCADCGGYLTGRYLGP